MSFYRALKFNNNELAFICSVGQNISMQIALRKDQVRNALLSEIARDSKESCSWKKKAKASLHS